MTFPTLGAENTPEFAVNVAVLFRVRVAENPDPAPVGSDAEIVGLIYPEPGTIVNPVTIPSVIVAVTVAPVPGPVPLASTMVNTVDAE